MANVAIWLGGTADGFPAITTASMLKPEAAKALYGGVSAKIAPDNDGEYP